MVYCLRQFWFSFFLCISRYKFHFCIVSGLSVIPCNCLPTWVRFIDRFPKTKCVIWRLGKGSSVIMSDKFPLSVSPKPFIRSLNFVMLVKIISLLCLSILSKIQTFSIEQFATRYLTLSIKIVVILKMILKLYFEVVLKYFSVTFQNNFILADKSCKKIRNTSLVNLNFLSLKSYTFVLCSNIQVRVMSS